MENSKVMYVVNSPLSSPTGGGRTRIVSAAVQARKFGYAVTMCCFFPPHQLLTQFKALTSGRRSLSSEMNGPVYYFPRLPFTRIGVVWAINDWYCGLIVYLMSVFTGINTLHCHGIDSAYYGLNARKLKKSISVTADIHGAVSEEHMYEREIDEPDAIVHRLDKIELTVLENADSLIFVSDAMRSHFKQKYGKEFDATVIPCATNAAGKDLNGTRDKLRSKNGLDEKLVFCYIGSGEGYQLPDTMCEFFKNVSEKMDDAYFLVFSHHKDVFERKFQDLNIASSKFKIEAVQRAEVFDVLQMGDIGFLLRDKSVVNRVASPTKFAEYCLSGMPVLTTEWVGDISDIVVDHKLGEVIDLDRLSVDDRMMTFFQDVRKNRSRYAESCSQYVRDEFSWEGFGSRLADTYRRARANR